MKREFSKKGSGKGQRQGVELDWKVSWTHQEDLKCPAQELGGTGEPWTGFEQGQAWPAVTCGDVPGPVGQVYWRGRDRELPCFWVDDGASGQTSWGFTEGAT